MLNQIYNIADDRRRYHRADIAREGYPRRLRQHAADEAAYAEREHQEHEAVDEARARGAERAVALAVGRGRRVTFALEPVLLNPARSRRPAHRRASDEAEGRAGEPRDRSALYPHPLHDLPVGRSCAGAADHRNRPRAEAEPRVRAERADGEDAEQILPAGYDNRENQTEKHRLAAALQLLKAHREADRREENVHEHDLQRVVEGDEGRARRVERRVHRREADAAHQRRGDAVPAEKRHLLAEKRAEPVKRRRERDGVVHIQVDFKHIPSP